MPDAALIASAALLGLAGTPHCAVMCGAACAATVGRGGTPAALAFHAARVSGYAIGGALAAASVGALAALAQFSPALRPLWTLLHAAALALGLWLMWQGRQPGWMSSVGRTRAPAGPAPAGWQRMQGPVRAAAVGGLWVAWPCGLLQSALLMAALTQTAPAGALAMAGFAVCSSAGLVLAPWAWQRLGRGGSAAALDLWLTRAAGAVLVAASSWALGHGLWARVAAYCFGP